MKRIALLAGVVLGLVGLVWVLFFRGPVVSVELYEVRRQPVVRSLDEDGLVRSDVQVDLAPRLQGKLDRWLVEDATQVRAGEVVAVLERADLSAALQAARAERGAAQAALEEAQARYAVQQRTVEADIQGSRSGVAVAEANLSRVRSGSRSQEIRSAEASQTAARARLDEARRELTRAETLHEQGFVPLRELEAARTAVATAEANLEQARQQLSLTREGARAEDVQVARSELVRAQAGLEASLAGTAQVEAALATVQTARERVGAAGAAVDQARAVYDQAELVSPVDGIVEFEEVEPGEVVGPGVVVARVVQPQQLWVEVLVDENDRASVEPGQEVVVVCDAYPSETFAGRLSRIDAQAFLKRELRGTPTQDEDRVFRARVDLQDGEGKLWPGMSVFAEIILGRTDPVLTVPREALLNRDGDWVLYVAQNGKARLREVQIGDRDVSRVQIASGLEEGEQVVLNPGKVDSGSRIAAKP